MSICGFLPYGLISQESGALALLLNYLRSRTEQIFLLRCNGMFSVCDRDEQSNWRRELTHCFRCMSESKHLAEWAGIAVEDLSGYLTPEEVDRSKRWVLATPTRQLKDAKFEDITPFELCAESFNVRAGRDRDQPLTSTNEQILRRLLVATIRMHFAAVRFAAKIRPGLTLAAGGRDLLSRTFLHALKSAGLEISTFSWELSARCVRISHPRADTFLDCPLVFDDITSMRTVSSSWPKEITSMLDEILVFLDLASPQLALPISR